MCLFPGRACLHKFVEMQKLVGRGGRIGLKEGWVRIVGYRRSESCLNSFNCTSAYKASVLDVYTEFAGLSRCSSEFEHGNWKRKGCAGPS